MQEYIAMWKNFANFSDRTSVRGFWMAILFNFLAGVVLGVLTAIVPFLGFLTGLYGLAVLVPGLAICVRRLRDAGKAWYFIFFSFIPLVGSIILIVFLCQQSVPSDDGSAQV